MKTLIFAWPEGPAEAYETDFLVGVWHPNYDLRVQWGTPSTLGAIASIDGRNWSMISSTVTLHSEQRALVHGVNDGLADDLEGLAFRGYVVDPPVTSWSSSDAILDYWREPPNRSHNGVFAAVRVCRRERSLELVCDALGVAPLYYRMLGDVVCFASNPRFLRVASDSMDRLAARSVIQMGYVTGNRALSSQVQRVPAGSVLRFGQDGKTCRTWFDFDRLLQGFSPGTTPRLADLEEVFQQAVGRCLRLSSGPYVLPLSSGYDSRRILTALQSRSVPFEALTVRVRQKGDRDLDGYWSSEMAKAFGFRHRIIEMESPRLHALSDATRRQQMDGESVHHTWTLSLLRAFPQESTVFFDGLAGDVLGEGGFLAQDRELYICPEDFKPALIAAALIDDSLLRVLPLHVWPSAEELRTDVADYARSLPEGRARADLAFLLLRTRRSVSGWSQFLSQRGHISVYPFLDLDHLSLAMRFDPLEKHEESLQAKCLREFWPEYYKFPGSRSVPKDSASGNPQINLALQRARLLQVMSECSLSDCWRALTRESFLKCLLARFSPQMGNRASWWLYPLLSVLSWESHPSNCWTVIKEA